MSKTTIVGAAMIVGAVAEIVRALAAGGALDWQSAGTALIGGIGFVLAADRAAAKPRNVIER
jgi:hypothetical protein